MLPGMSSRLEKDITDLYVKKILKGDRGKLKGGPVKIKIEDPPSRYTMVFQGAAVLANMMKDNDDFWLTAEEYRECGDTILDRKFGRIG